MKPKRKYSAIVEAVIILCLIWWRGCGDREYKMIAKCVPHTRV